VPTSVDQSDLMTSTLLLPRIGDRTWILESSKRTSCHKPDGPEPWTNPTSPIYMSDLKTNQIVTPELPPMNKFRYTVEPSSIPPGTPLDTATPVDHSPHHEPPTTSTDDLQTTMIEIESV